MKFATLPKNYAGNCLLTLFLYFCTCQVDQKPCLLVSWLYYKLLGSVVDPHHIDADADPRIRKNGSGSQLLVISVSFIFPVRFFLVYIYFL